MISVPLERVICLRHDIALCAMICAAAHEERISYHAAARRMHIMRRKPYIMSRKRHIIDPGVFQMENNPLVDLSFEFAKTIVELVDSIKAPKSSYMIDQLARSGTSIGANIHEAQYAHSKADFIAKFEIALKEANETSYWLKLLYETNRIEKSEFDVCEF